MPRPRKPIRSIQLNVALPEDVHTQLSLHLWSDLEQRIPQGKFQEFLCERIREFFSSRRLDLAPFANCDPGVFLVSGQPATLVTLEKLLKGDLPR